MSPLAAQQAAAPPRLTELTLEQLGEVRITSLSKLPDEAWRTPGAIHVITAEEIRRSGATSIPEVLRLAPGIEVARADADHWSIGVRGFGDQFSKSLLVLIDGRSIYTPLFAGIYWPAHDTLLQDVERIEVIRGPGGIVWGANAVNGVINIITKRAADTRGALATLGAGNVDEGIAAVRYGGGSGNLDYRVWGKAFSRNPLSHANGATYDAWWMGQSGFRADWTPRPGESLTVQGDASGGRHGQRVMVSTFAPPGIVRLDDPVEVSGGNLALTWQRQLGAGNELQVQAYYDRTDWQASHFAEARNTGYVDVVHAVALGRRHRATWGVGARWSAGDFSPTVASLDFSPRGETARYYNGFLQDEFQLVPRRLALTGGVKVEHNSYTGVEVQPTARLMWTPGERHAFWTAVSRSIRTPSRIERSIRVSSFNSFVTVPGVAIFPVFLRVTGNEAFESEKVVGFEAGYRTLAIPRLYVDVSAFRHDWADLASFGRGATLFEATPAPAHVVVEAPYVNGVEGATNGVEIAPDWRPLSAVQIKGSYSLLLFDLKSRPISVDANAVARYEGSSPRHQVRTQLRVTMPRATEIDVAYRFVSELPMRNTPRYHAVDLRLGWSPRPGLELAVNGRDLLDPHHVEFAPQVGVPRSVFASVTWTRGREPQP